MIKDSLKRFGILDSEKKNSELF